MGVGFALNEVGEKPLEPLGLVSYLVILARRAKLS